MTTRARRRWVIVLGSLSALSLAGWVLLFPRNHDPFTFLKGHPVIDVAVRPPGSWSPSELRSYSWRQPWQSVVAEARKELGSFGLKEQPKHKNSGNSVVWCGEVENGGMCGSHSDYSVMIEQGRSRPICYSEPTTDKNPEWVTVIVASDLDNTWINILRYTFFKMGD